MEIEICLELVADGNGYLAGSLAIVVGSRAARDPRASKQESRRRRGERYKGSSRQPSPPQPRVPGAKPSNTPLGWVP